MLSAYVGEEKFLKGVSLYLKKHLYGNSFANDLWDGIAEATGEDPFLRYVSASHDILDLDIRTLMDNWITKVFPQVGDVIFRLESTILDWISCCDSNGNENGNTCQTR